MKQKLVEALAHQVKVADDKRFFIFRVGSSLEEIFVRQQQIELRIGRFVPKEHNALVNILGDTFKRRPDLTILLDLTGAEVIPEHYDGVTGTVSLRAQRFRDLRLFFGAAGRDYPAIQERDSDEEETMFHCVLCGYRVDRSGKYFRCHACGNEIREDPRIKAAV